MWVSGMGTEVQSKIHFPGYHSIKDLNGNANVGGEWPSHHESRSLKNGQFHNLFSTNPASDPFLGFDKVKLKQTILKHESVFRHQLHELHRLYKKQADLMNEIKCKRPKKLLIDLERPADEYMDSEEEQLGASGVENHSSNQNYKVLSERGVNSPFREALKSGSDAAASDSNPYLTRSRDFTDLNQPVLFEKVSTSISVDVPIPRSVISCSKEEKQSWYLSANSHSAFQYLGTELSNFHRERERGVHNLHLQKNWNKKDQLPVTKQAGFGSSITYENGTVLRSDPRAAEPQNKRTIFGVDISDGDRNASAMTSHTVAQSGLINSETVFVASQRRHPSTLSQLLAVKEHHCSNSSAYSNNNAETYIKNPEFAGDLSCNSKPTPCSRTQMSFQNSSQYQIYQQNFVSNDLQRKQENAQGELSWYREMLLHISEVSKEKEDSHNSNIIGLPISYKPRASEELSSCSFPARPNDPRSTIVRDNSVKSEFFETDTSCKAEGQVVEKGLVNQDTDFRPCIDLNLCVIEEQDAQAPSSPKLDLNTPVEIDLEVDALKYESREPHEEQTRDAAEALVAISSLHLHNLEGNVPCNVSEVSPHNSLNWFAEIVSLYNGNLENGLETVPANDDHCQEEQNQDEIDYFELMTLSLEETKVDEHYCFKPQAQEDSKDETTMPKRARRGQARRGRQRKDFQRDVLPGLISLSRYEVTDDLQIIEGLIGASGGTWQSSLSRRNGAKGGRGRGRRNSGGSPTVSSPCLTQIQEPKSITTGLDEKSLMSWGKRTRRLPRQRCLNPVTNPRISVT